MPPRREDACVSVAGNGRGAVHLWKKEGQVDRTAECRKTKTAEDGERFAIYYPPQIAISGVN
jgi:hypothetical protein